METVLITGGNGMIGSRLSKLLLAKGYEVRQVSRHFHSNHPIKMYHWDPKKQFVEPAALLGVDHIIHLAGANIGQKRWTSKRKREILESRIQTGKLLVDYLQNNNHSVRTFISASAVGYYGSVTSDYVFTEKDPPSSGFLGDTCRLWEKTSGSLSAIGIRVVNLRMGVVLANGQGLLKKILPFPPLGIIPVLGNGQQYLPWIHIEDVCAMYLYALQQDRMIGSYNAVSPEHIRLVNLLQCLRNVSQKGFLIPVPSLLLRLALGEMAEMVLKGSRVSSDKIQLEGFEFSFPGIQQAIIELLTHQ